MSLYYFHWVTCSVFSFSHSVYFIYYKKYQYYYRYYYYHYYYHYYYYYYVKCKCLAYSTFDSVTCFYLLLYFHIFIWVKNNKCHYSIYLAFFSSVEIKKKTCDYSLILLLLSETGLKLVQSVRKILFQHSNTMTFSVCIDQDELH